MNLVTDGMTAVALGLEPVEKGIMQRPPRGVQEPVLNRDGMVMILILGGYIGIVTLWLFHHYQTAQTLGIAQTVAFTGIIVLEKMNVFNFRSLRAPISVIGIFSNLWVLGAWILTIGLQICAVYVPFLQRALHTVPLGWQEWGLIIVMALPVFILTELYKWYRWHKTPRHEAIKH
jgi:Ca2+-transporting ATPase